MLFGNKIRQPPELNIVKLIVLCVYIVNDKKKRKTNTEK